VSAFGGAFLAMVGLQFFFDHEKDVHWVRQIEEPLSRLGRVDAVSLGLVLLTLYGICKLVEPNHQMEFLVAGIFGLVTYIAVDGMGALLKAPEGSDAVRSGFASFLYLEVLDASFSFDGVIGAFAITSDPIIIALGLGLIGAMFVRSLTVYLVRQGTLSEYVYLEHGAHWAIGALAFILMVSIGVHISEFITGLIGVAFIGASLWTSIRRNRRLAAKGEEVGTVHA
jgi:hypothetical protein